MLQILKLGVAKNASDIHITADSPPVLRVDGHLFRMNIPPLNFEQTKEMAYSIISDEQKARFESERNLDFSFFVKNLARFRGTLFFQKGSVAVTLRILNFAPKTLEEIDPHPSLFNLLDFPNGLVLVTGPTGSGKSTTLSAFINHINETRRSHILTIEDPIEIIHEHKNSIVNQREVGSDCFTFADGLKSAMRADPDICLIGEMRDRETIESTLKLAETGHLVFSTLHTNSAIKSIDRIAGVFSLEDREQILAQLSTVLQAVISQKLVESTQGGRVLATEVLLATPAVRNLIRENKAHQIYNAMQTGTEQGMLTMNTHLAELVSQGLVSPKEALSVTAKSEELKELLQTKGKYTKNLKGKGAA